VDDVFQKNFKSPDLTLIGVDVDAGEVFAFEKFEHVIALKKFALFSLYLSVLLFG
jgi:hypothetical protein